jgi:hypothetical protein
MIDSKESFYNITAKRFDMSDTSVRMTDWYKKFLKHPEFATRPNKHPEVAKFIKDPKNLAQYLKDADDIIVDYLKYLPSTVYDPSVREALLEFLSRKGYELQYLPSDLKKDDTLIRTALESDPRAIYFLEDSYRDDAEFVLPYLIKSPIILTLLSERLQNDIDFLSRAVNSNTDDVLAWFPEKLQNVPALITEARIAIFKFGLEDAWDNVDWAKLQICEDSSWTFTAACGTKRYEGMGYSQIDLEEFSISGTWKKINHSVFCLIPTVPLRKVHRIGESKSTEQYPRGFEDVCPIDLPYMDIKAGHFKMKRYFSSGNDAIFQVSYGTPKFLL